MSGYVRVILAALLLAPIVTTTVTTAQSERPARVAVLSWFQAPPAGALDQFRQRLAELGHVEGRNIVFEFHSAEERNDRAAAIAADLARRQVDVIVVLATPAAHAVKNATGTIPIVALVADPEATGLVASHARPGGNITGITSASPDLAAKRLELLREIRPQLKRVAFLGSSRDPQTATFLRGTQRAADSLSIELTPILIGGPEDFGVAFAAMADVRVEALIVQPLFFDHREMLAKLALTYSLPMISDLRPFAEAGSLLAYGADSRETYRRAAGYIDRVLKGAKPADLPIEQANWLSLAVNLRTAKALGIVVPPAVLQRADEVIE